MRHATCSQCGKSGPMGSYFVYGNQIYCPDCKEFLRFETVPGASPAALLDPTICARCGADNGNSEYQRLGALPFCQTCHSYVSAHPYPAWLKAGLFALLALLVVALVHGRRYFSAGRQMYIGEKLVEEGKCAIAVGHLKQTVQVAPGSDKAVLLLAKASLLSGDPETAEHAIDGHNGGKGFEQDSDFGEVQALFTRAGSAMTAANKAGELMKQEGMAQQAASLMHQAAATYPEMTALADAAAYLDSGAAFDRKDFDKYLSLAEDQWKAHPESAAMAGMVASAQACKYASTGTAEWKQKAEETMEKAKGLAQKSPEDMQSFEEYAERIRYRLTSREIIDKPEYDRRFRSGKKAGTH